MIPNLDLSECRTRQAFVASRVFEKAPPAETIGVKEGGATKVLWLFSARHEWLFRAYAGFEMRVFTGSPRILGARHAA